MSSQNLILGRGKVYFDAYAPGTQTTTGRRYIGNTPDFSLDVTATQLDHYGSDQGLKVKDDFVILQLDRKGSFKTDEVSIENLSLFLIGSQTTQVQTTQTAATSSIGPVLIDRYYQVGVTPQNLTGVRNISNVTVTTVPDSGAGVPLVLGTDYTVDLPLGLIYILTTAPNVVSGTTKLSVTYNVGTGNRDQIATTSVAAVDGALSFIAYNPKGTQRDYFMPYVSLTPNGAFNLKGDTWQEVSFNLEILLIDPSMSHIYLDGRPYAPGSYIPT